MKEASIFKKGVDSMAFFRERASGGKFKSCAKAVMLTAVQRLWCGIARAFQVSQFGIAHSLARLSTRMVTGPSLMREIFMSAPKIPRPMGLASSVSKVRQKFS